MKALYGLVLGAAILAPLALSGCGQGTAPAPRTITVSGEGAVRPKPDLVILQLGVVSRDPSLEAAQTNVSKKVAAALAALQTIGVKPEEVQTTDFSVDRYTVAIRKRQSRVMYRVYNNVSVRTGLVSKAGKIVDTMVHLGINGISGPAFGLKDLPAARRDALDLAFNNAKLDAERLAKAGGMRLAGIQTLNVGGGYDAMNRIGVPQDASVSEMPAAKPVPGGPPMPISSGQVRVSSTVSVSFRVE
jgi:uncharacterized protein YggE